METAYKFRLYPTPEQEELMQKTFGCVRFVFNRFLAKRKEKYKDNKETLNYNDCSAELTSLKKELEWLKEVDSTALQSSLKDLDEAYRDFFRRVKKGEVPGFPKFKSKRDNKKSYKSKMNIKVFENSVQIPKLGSVSAKVSREVQGRILNATVSQNASGKYYVSLCCTDVEIPQYESTGAAVGIDLGIKSIAITSGGEVYENSRCLKRHTNKLTREQRRLSRKQKGSNNRNKQRVKTASVHERVVNQRTDSIHKMTTELVKNYDIICIEDLAVKNMVRNHRLAKSISDAAWGEIRWQLTYKCARQHKALVTVDRFFPSSQMCICGYKNAEVKNLSIRAWNCPECGKCNDRDINATQNIRNEGLRILSAV